MNYQNSQTRIKGRVGKVISESVGSDDSDAFVKLSIATNDNSYKDKNDEWQDVTTWHTVVAWRGIAKAIMDKVGKGDYLDILGQYKNENWEDKKGQKHYSMVLQVGRFELLRKANES